MLIKEPDPRLTAPTTSGLNLDDETTRQPQGVNGRRTNRKYTNGWSTRLDRHTPQTLRNLGSDNKRKLVADSILNIIFLDGANISAVLLRFTKPGHESPKNPSSAVIFSIQLPFSAEICNFLLHMGQDINAQGCRACVVFKIYSSRI
jgi:hypothetical protein